MLNLFLTQLVNLIHAHHMHFHNWHQLRAWSLAHTRCLPVLHHYLAGLHRATWQWLLRFLAGGGGPRL